MADITNVQAIKFTVESIRPLADLLAKFYYEANKVRDRYTALGGAVLIPNTADKVLDGSATNGKQEVTGVDLNAFLGIAATYLMDIEATDKAKLLAILKVAPGDNNPVR